MLITASPSHTTVGGFSERFLLERGFSVGPRIFQSGEPLFGSEGWPELHAEIVDMREARDALQRIRAEGGPSSFSYKNYQLPSRAARQRLLLQAREMGMLCVPEGGMNFDWDITYIVDGMTTVEHAMVPSVLYDDVLTLWSLSGTATTPTHVVGYGGAFGEEQVWSTRNVAEDDKCVQCRTPAHHANALLFEESADSSPTRCWKATRRGHHAHGIVRGSAIRLPPAILMSVQRSHTTTCRVVLPSSSGAAHWEMSGRTASRPSGSTTTRSCASSSTAGCLRTRSDRFPCSFAC